MRRVVPALSKGRMGNPLDEATEVGSIISAEQLARVERYVQMARETPGARIICGGEPPRDESLRRGYFYVPTLIEGIPADSAGLPRRDFRSGSDCLAVERALTRYSLKRMIRDTGLAAVIWTRDLARSMQFIDRIQAGFVQVNQFSVAEASVEYGGTKISGIGRELSLESMLEHFTWSKTVIINYGTSGDLRTRKRED